MRTATEIAIRMRALEGHYDHAYRARLDRYARELMRQLANVRQPLIKYFRRKRGYRLAIPRGSHPLPSPRITNETNPIQLPRDGHS